MMMKLTNDLFFANPEMHLECYLTLANTCVSNFALKRYSSFGA
jgi:hypothetical protein